MIEYGGTKEIVEKQLKCEHIWHGSCMDNMSRYYKCTECFCLDRDMTKEQYLEELGYEEGLLLNRTGT